MSAHLYKQTHFISKANKKLNHCQMLTSGFWDCILPLCSTSFTFYTDCLARSDVIDTNRNTNGTQNASDTKILSLFYRFCINTHISLYRDFIHLHSCCPTPWSMKAFEKRVHFSDKTALFYPTDRDSSRYGLFFVWCLWVISPRLSLNSAAICFGPLGFSSLNLNNFLKSEPTLYAEGFPIFALKKKVDFR